MQTNSNRKIIPNAKKLQFITLTNFFFSVGGTADITVHTRKYDDTLEELRPASGGPWGGKAVDDSFLTFMEDICGRDLIQKLKEDHQDDYIALFNRDFEVKKRTKLTNDKVNFAIPYSMQQLFKKNKTSLSDVIKKSKYASKNVTYNTHNHRMLIPADIFKELFRPSAKSIVDHIRLIFRERKFGSLDVILMVGGFSNSEEVHVAMKKEFDDKKIIVPADAELAVLKGAVLFGHNKGTISIRVARFTYGMQNWPIFINGRHPENKKVIINGETRCKDTFLKCVEYGQELTPGYEVNRNFQVLKTENGKFQCRIYKCAFSDPQFVDEPGVTLVGTLEIPIQLEEGKVVEIEQTLIFGDTTLRFRANNRKTNQQFETSFHIVSGDAH